MAGVLRYSSNTGIYAFGMEVDEKERFNYLQDFGFGTSSGLNFEARAREFLGPMRSGSMPISTLTCLAKVSPLPPSRWVLPIRPSPMGSAADPILVDSCTGPGGEILYDQSKGLPGHLRGKCGLISS